MACRSLASSWRGTMNETVEGSHRVKAGGRQVELGDVGLDEPGFRRVLPGQRELPGRDVDARHLKALSQGLRRGQARPAAENPAPWPRRAAHPAALACIARAPPGGCPAPTRHGAQPWCRSRLLRPVWDPCSSRHPRVRTSLSNECAALLQSPGQNAAQDRGQTDHGDASLLWVRPARAIPGGADESLLSRQTRPGR